MAADRDWRFAGEVGITYASADPGRAHERLFHPVLADRAADGSYLIVDEPARQKNLTVLFETRTRRVSPAGETLFDSMALGIHDGYGCLLPSGRVAILRRTTWELLMFDASGAALGRIDLSPISRRMPRVVSATRAGTFLVSFVDTVYQGDIAEVDREGRLLWAVSSPPHPLGCPTSLQLLPNDHILLADSFGHAVIELRRDGTVAWQYGTRGDPSSDIRHLSNPTAAFQTDDGRRIIADTRNDRVLVVVGEDASTLAVQGPPLSGPTFVKTLSDGHHLLCDAGNRRVIEIDSVGRVVWQYGNTLASRRMLSYPRSVERMPGGVLLVADTCHDRVIAVDQDGSAHAVSTSRTGLFWPRCARGTPRGTILVADGRSSRIVELSPTGETLRTLRTLHCADGDLVLGDPHDVRELEGGMLLVTDAQRDLVVETDWSGQVRWALGGRGAAPLGGVALRDPHSAQVMRDGRVLIADSGSGRVLFADPATGSTSSLQTVTAGDGSQRRLRQPRFVEQVDDGTLLIVDTANNRVFGATEEGQMLWEVADAPGSPLPSLFQPRWAHLTNDNELLISDHWQHRILQFTRPGQPAAPTPL